MKAMSNWYNLMMDVFRSPLIAILLLIALMAMQVEKCKSDKRDRESFYDIRKIDILKMVQLTDSLFNNQLEIIENQDIIKGKQDSTALRQKRILENQKKMLEQ